MNQAASAYQKILRQLRECSEVANLDRRIGLCSRRYRQEASQSGRFALHFVTDIFACPVRKNAHPASLCGQRLQIQTRQQLQSAESIRVLTGQQ